MELLLRSTRCCRKSATLTKYEIHNLPHLKINRQELRKNQTSAEETLWQLLRKEQLFGRKFRRQHSIENFIVDFYCASEMLVIELDGVHHAEKEIFENDEIRNARLQQLNYKVLRFPKRSNFHLSGCRFKNNCRKFPKTKSYLKLTQSFKQQNHSVSKTHSRKSFLP
ncbi:endonuclease domain-containing protein [Adhaeribacter terreus]|uniref:Endonuclease domain-containing protein n=1 Tax=Adhaeribacter terreus TaxID=529703 RepID=A0ABW0EAM7_9BACT